MPLPIVALFSPNANQLTETFIKSHRDLLNADVRLLYGGYRPQFSEKKGPIVRQNWLSKSFRRFEEYIFLYNNMSNSHEKAIARFLISEKVDVALAEYGITGTKVYKACRASGIPLIVHFHGADAHMHKILKNYGSQYKKMFQYASFIIGVSHYMCRQLKILGVPDEKLVYNPYGPNATFFECNPSLTSNTLVAIGRFIPKKAPEFTIRAFAKVIEDFPQLRLKMYGDGESLEMCRLLIKELGISDKVSLPGAINHNQVKELFEDALAFVQHSVVAPDGDAEGTPVAVLEASAAGLPVVATIHAGIPDVIINNKTGILVPEYDLNAYVKAIKAIASNPEHSRIMGLAGRENIRSFFTMERHIKVLNDLIQKAVSQGNL